MFELLLFSGANAHGNMVLPATWVKPVDHGGQKPFEGCYMDYSTIDPTDVSTYMNAQCFWFTNYTFVEERTMEADSKMRTYGKADPDYTIMGRNPWAAPGYAEVWSPCGVMGGNPKGCPVGDEASAGKECPGGGMGWGADARAEYGKSLPYEKNTPASVEAGGVLEAAWVPRANHGGGYAYRLCKVPDSGDMMDLTEECFQAGHLNFANEFSWVQYGEDAAKRIRFKAVRSSNGTFPKGAIWAQDPIPVCNQIDGGVTTESNDNCYNAYMSTGTATQFKPHVPGVQGFGEYLSTGQYGFPTFEFTIVDQLQIPSNLDAGNYVLSFRWDCEQTSQIWNTCADITVTASDDGGDTGKKIPTMDGGASKLASLDPPTVE